VNKSLSTALTTALARSLLSIGYIRLKHKNLNRPHGLVFLIIKNSVVKTSGFFVPERLVEAALCTVGKSRILLSVGRNSVKRLGRIPRLTC
jgi:hypothetical protein